MALTWIEQLQNKLNEEHGKKKGEALGKKYFPAFPHEYDEERSIVGAFEDIEYMEKLSPEHLLEINFYLSHDKSHRLHLRLYQWEAPIPLSDILPMLENMDLRTDTEHPYKIELSSTQCIWISDFTVLYPKAAFDIEKGERLFREAFTKIYYGYAENDGFNKLVLACLLSWREILVLRAYAKYLQQVRFRFRQDYIEIALVNNPALAKLLIDLFYTLHDPKTGNNRMQLAADIETTITRELNKVRSLDEDHIIRRMVTLIKATLRCNYFQLNQDKQPKDYFSFKLNSRTIPDLPLPVPLYEIFVYSPRFEAVHLRNTKVARGGIRWSDRLQDFRTEILGLMKAQTVKNSVIVPSGAKGGFVLKRPPTLSTREALQTEVLYCYRYFISGLLDITDNIIEDKFVHPKNVVCFDDFDPYLVVAADKGTASFSNLANSISIEYNFWLFDAFASGGSTGYDHKKMGITARGAWESIKRHFHELNVDVMNVDICVVGIGDMSGDVFGNGMLYTKHIKLVGAFDHRHIFIDPDPDPEVSYYERLRLFNLPTSSWADYNPKLISKGGGVFARSLKSIPLSAKMKQLLGVEEDALDPNDMIRALLKSSVDLLYNGGIGTYVKASTESDADVGDRTNDYCRVNGDELRCRVVGEGGNLGFTQLGRIEYALNDGLIFTDFIDNSAGVDCSDHEVNLKILLDAEIHKKKLTLDKRNELLAAMTEEVASLVLKDNYDQALVMSVASYHSRASLLVMTTYIQDLQAQKILDRRVEFLPTDKELLDRKASNQGLTRPELAVLLAYTKIYLKQEILKTDLPEDDYLHQIVVTAFPEYIRKKYKTAMYHHRLHRDIIATQLSNEVVNTMGIIYVYQIENQTGSNIKEIIRAYTIASQVFKSKNLEHIIDSLGFKIPLSEQYEMFYQVRHLINLATRWFLHSKHINEDLETVIAHFTPRVEKLKSIIPKLMSGTTQDYLQQLSVRFANAGLSDSIATEIATYRAIYTALNIIEIATLCQLDLEKTARVYFASGERLNLLWFRDQIANDTREGDWNALARLTLRDELDISQRELTLAILQQQVKESDPDKLIELWLRKNTRLIERWEKILSMLHASSNIEYTMFFIAIREFIGLIVVHA